MTDKFLRSTGNWDTLDEVLHDFDWMNAKSIIIMHLDIPVLEPQDLITMFRVLGRAVKIMKEDQRSDSQLPTGKHKPRVIFPQACKQEMIHYDPLLGFPC